MKNRRNTSPFAVAIFVVSIIAIIIVALNVLVDFDERGYRAKTENIEVLNVTTKQITENIPPKVKEDQDFYCVTLEIENKGATIFTPERLYCSFYSDENHYFNFDKYTEFKDISLKNKILPGQTAKYDYYLAVNKGDTISYFDYRPNGLYADEDDSITIEVENK